jgi:hypothetical protein
VTTRARTVVVAFLLLASCAGPPRPRLADADYPGELRPPAALPPDVLWQQRVTAIWGEGEQRGFDAAVQKQGETLTVIGMSPVGAPGFVLVLCCGNVALTNDSGMEMPFPPRFVVLDVQRVFYPWLAPAAGGVATDGEVVGTVGGERITERRTGGRLVERRFERLDGKPAGTIVVRYEWGEVPQSESNAPKQAPARATLDNAWFGYRIVIDTHTEALLPPKGT